MEALIKCLDNITEASIEALEKAKTNNPGWDKGVLSVRAYSAVQEARDIIKKERTPTTSDVEIDDTKTTPVINR